MTSVVYNSNIFEIFLEDKHVEILETLIIFKESSGKCGNSSIMSILSLLMANSIVLFPNMHAFNYMSSVSAVLHKVEHTFLTKLRHDLDMEEYDITDSEIKINASSVNFVDPVSRYFMR